VALRTVGPVTFTPLIRNSGLFLALSKNLLCQGGRSKQGELLQGHTIQGFTSTIVYEDIGGNPHLTILHVFS
jgi:hypothetical protein